MIEIFADQLSKWFVKRNWVETEDTAVFQYGLETILANSLNLVTFFLLAILFHRMLDGMVFLVLFIGIRQFTGGYHAKSYGGCYLTFCFISLVLFILLRITPSEWLRPLTILLTLLGGLMIVLFAPAPNPEKTFSIDQLKRARVISIVLVCVTGVAVLLMGSFTISLRHTYSAALSLLTIGGSLMTPTKTDKGGGKIEEGR